MKQETLSVSQGYIFAANLENPKFYEIFNDILKKPVTNEELKRLLEKAATGSDTPPVPRGPFSGFYSNMDKIKTAFEKGKAYTQQAMETLITDL